MQPLTDRGDPTGYVDLARTDSAPSALPAPTPPAAGEQVVPRQEPVTHANQPTVDATVNAATGVVTLRLANAGPVARQLGVYPNGAPSARYDLTAGSQASTTIAPPSDGAYDIAVYGADGFLREFVGRRGGAAIEIAVTMTDAPDRPRLRIIIGNPGRVAATVRIAGAGRPVTFRVAAGTTVTTDRHVIRDEAGRYDIVATVDGDPAYRRRFAGQLPANTG